MLQSNGPSNKTDYLDVYDDFVQEYLKARLKELGTTYARIEPIIGPCIKNAKETIASLSKPLDNLGERFRLSEISFASLKMILSQNSKIAEIRRKIRSFRCVILVGAGVSDTSDEPLSGDLDTLLHFCKANNFSELLSDNKKCSCFKENFNSLNNKKKPNESHKAIAKSFPNYTCQIITLNWDNLLEGELRRNHKVFTKVNTESVPPSEYNLWKFHGDVENITVDNIPGSGGWIFPNSEGHVFSSFKKHVEKSFLRSDPYVIILAGYRHDYGVIDLQVVGLLADGNRREVYEVSMRPEKLQERGFVVGPSDYILPKMLP